MPHDVGQQHTHCHRLAASLRLRIADLTVEPGTAYVDCLIGEIQVAPSKAETLADAQANARCQQSQGSLIISSLLISSRLIARYVA